MPSKIDSNIDPQMTSVFDPFWTPKMDQKSVQNRSKMEIKKRIQMWSQFSRKNGPRKKSSAGNAAAPESLFKAEKDWNVS